MKIFFNLIIILFTAVSFSSGQGTVRGKITDENGETVIGATVVLKSNRSIGTSADLDGNYSLKIPDSTTQTIVITFISYKTIEETVHVAHGEVLIRNFKLRSSANDIQQVEVTAKAVRAREYYVETIKKNSAATLDYISSETMKKTGDVSVITAVARIAGVSTSGGFITVRGIGDRYIKTSVNGSRIPTLDPFTNNIKLDLFPASLVDNIIITKTASPDLPGDWAGAYLSVETKDYPELLSVNAEISLGYNNQSTFKDVLSSQRSSTDWLGFDSGLREHSHNAADFTPAIISPTPYQQFVALGLGPYFNSLGVNQNNWLQDGNNGDTYYKLGLIQMGLLAPAQINDPVAFANAKALYASHNYGGQAFHVINAPAVKTGQSFPDSWNTTTRKAPLDFTQSFSVGNQVSLFGKPLGFLFGYRYSNGMVYDPNSIAQRPYPVTGLLRSYKEQEASRETNGWSALCNLAYKFNPDNSISFLFMPNVIGVNNVRSAYDVINYSTELTQFYEQRKQMVYQFKSENFFPVSKIKMEANASYTDGNSSAPDFKDLEYKPTGIGDDIKIDPTNDPANRYYRYLTDKLFDSRISAEVPLESKPDLPRKLKVGAAYQEDHQKSDQYNYQLNVGNGIAPATNSIDDLLSLNNFAIQNDAIIWHYTQDMTPINHTFGRSSIVSGFAMVDYAITTRFRFSGGLRIEKAKIYTDIYAFDSLGYAPNDIRRNYSPGLPDANPGKLDEVSYLPSANFIYKLKNDEVNPVNLRLNFSQTVARPSIRELSDVSVFDYELQAPVTGNSELKMVHIMNYDLRLESYFKSGDNISVSLFYKNFKDPIELIYSDTYHWQNVEKSNLAGIELEGRKQITKKLEFRANITLAKSKTTFVRTRVETVGGIQTTYYEDTITRPNFGQAPYILNGILSYTADSIGLNLTVSYNRQGARLVLGSNVSSVPDIYELPRDLIDFKVIKKITKHFSASLTVRNILNAPIRRSYNYPEGFTMDYDRYTYGTSYIFGLIYKL